MTDELPTKGGSLDHLADIVRHLRGPEGCPWDKKQTPATLIKYLREECHELVEAIEEGDPNHICEEIGDLFFILTILSQCYSEEKSFTLFDCLHAVSTKMVRRHPHVFGDLPVTDEETLRAQWLRIKAEEKSGR